MNKLLSTVRLASNQIKNSSSSASKMILPEIIKQLESFAPLSFAESWDNVGLLVEPSTSIEIKKILMTNDLTESVMEEAVKCQANMIISYHPPIFAGLKRITSKTWKERIVVQCLENKIALYSPHTAWDACPNGVGDWLASSLPLVSKVPATPSAVDPNFGSGRVCQVDGKLTLREAIEKIKVYTGLPDVRVGIATNSSLDSTISSYGVCAGSGHSVLKAIKVPIDLFITGELSHHEALDAISNQISVITLNHSNSERGYLKDFKKILAARLDNTVEIFISEKDADPLSTY